MVNVSARHPLVKDVHYRELSVREGGCMRFELLGNAVDFLFDQPVLPEGETRVYYSTYKDSSPQPWLVLEAMCGRVLPFYRWNGNSIKAAFLGCRVGTPDFQNGCCGSTIEKSLFHDALFQFSAIPELTQVFDLKQANHAFRTVEGVRPFLLNGIYCQVLDLCSHKTWGKLDDPNLPVFCEITRK